MVPLTLSPPLHFFGPAPVLRPRVAVYDADAVLREKPPWLMCLIPGGIATPSPSALDLGDPSINYVAR